MFLPSSRAECTALALAIHHDSSVHTRLPSSAGMPTGLRPLVLVWKHWPSPLVLFAAGSHHSPELEGAVFLENTRERESQWWETDRTAGPEFTAPYIHALGWRGQGSLLLGQPQALPLTESRSLPLGGNPVWTASTYISLLMMSQLSLVRVLTAQDRTQGSEQQAEGQRAWLTVTAFASKHPYLDEIQLAFTAECLQRALHLL